MRPLALLLTLIAVCSPALAVPKIIRNTTAEQWRPLGEFVVPNGSANIALGKPVSSSDERPTVGSLAMLTDGEKEAVEGSWLGLKSGVQWVQIDLQRPSKIYGIQFWHYLRETRVYRDVVVQVADDADFVTGVRTLFNCDRDNSAGLGMGTDREFYESREGFRIDTRGKNYEGLTARYVRLYSNGNTSERENHYIEVEVIGKPIGPVPPVPNDMASRVKRGELKSWKFEVETSFYSRWKLLGDDSKLPPPTELPQEFLVPREVFHFDKPSWLRPHLAITWSFSAQPPWKQDYYFYPTLPWHRLSSGRQWMQADLKQNYLIHAIQLWHWQNDEAGRVCRDVVVQTADDAKFTRNVRTLFNNDSDNSAKLGKGSDREYREGPNGLLIDTRGKELRGLRARHFRFHSRSDCPSENTRYIKAEFVWQSPPEKPQPQPQHPPGRPDLMFWQTKIPFAPFL